MEKNKKVAILESILTQKNNKKVIFSVLDKLKDEVGYDNVAEVLNLIKPKDLGEINLDRYGESLSLKNNRNIRQYNKNPKLTNSHYCMWWRCKNDFVYFIEHYIKILNPTKGGFYLMELRPFQENMIYGFEGIDKNLKLKYQDPNDWENEELEELEINFKNSNRIIAKISRQMGKSTIYAVYLLWKTIFYKEQRIGIIANKFSVSKEILRRYQKSYGFIPLWMQQGVKIWNRTSVELENGSIINTSGQTEDAFSGFTLNILIMDEVAKWNTRIYKAIKESLFPTVSAFGDDGKIIMVSTPLGDNFFKDEWIEALKNVRTDGKLGSNFYPIEGTYRDAPERNSLAWRENSIKELGSKRAFAQEHEARFVSIDGTLIKGEVLVQMRGDIPIEVQQLRDELPKYYKYISLYEQPIKGNIYIVVEDPNESTKREKNDTREEPDGIGLQVIDITDIEKGWRQVGTVNIPGGEMSYLETDIIAYKLAKYYRDAWIFIENNLGGKTIANNINFKFEYDKVFFSKEDEGGYRMNKDTKFMTGSIFKFVVENNKLLIRDEDTINQLKFFKEDMKATSDMHDDLIMPLLGAFYFLLLSEDEIFDMFDDEEYGNFILTSMVDIKEKVLSNNNNLSFESKDMAVIFQKVLDDYIDMRDRNPEYFLDVDEDVLIC